MRVRVSEMSRGGDVAPRSTHLDIHRTPGNNTVESIMNTTRDHRMYRSTHLGFSDGYRPVVTDILVALLARRPEYFDDKELQLTFSQSHTLES